MPVRAEPPKGTWTKAEHDAWVAKNGRPLTDHWDRTDAPPGLVEGQPLGDIGLTVTTNP